MKTYLTKQKVAIIKALINEGKSKDFIADKFGTTVRQIDDIDTGKVRATVLPLTSNQKTVLKQMPPKERNQTIMVPIDSGLSEWLISVLKEKQQESEREIAIIQLKIDALRRRDTTFLPPIAIKEFEEKGLLKDGKFIDDFEESLTPSQPS